MNYLTLQDVLFLNLQLTGSRQPFDYSRLEEATFYQFASGSSTDLVAQGARFLTGFVKMAPFESGNLACAFAGLVAFLEANGKTLDLSDEDGPAWLGQVMADRTNAREALESKIMETHLHVTYGVPDLQEICASVLSRFPLTIRAAIEDEQETTLTA